MSGRYRRALRFLAWVAALAVPVSCDLNPQPEVPSGSAAGATSGGGGLGGSTGVGGGGLGGQSSGGSGGLDASYIPCGCPVGQVCLDGACVDDPCEPNTCDAKQACKPDPDFLASSCLDTCAGVTCPTGEACTDGKCLTTGCTTGCGVGEVCAPVADGGHECVADACAGDAGGTCDDGDVCDPATGSCVPDPCTGVKCPAGQACAQGECYFDGDAGAEAGDAALD